MVETPPEPAAAPTSPRVRRPLGDVPRKIIITLLILGALAGIAFTGKAAVTGSDSATSDQPTFVDQLIPVSGGDVPRQSAVGIDVAEGYDAYLIVNGEEIRTTEDGLIKDLGTGVVRFQPAPGLVIEELETDQNCVVARVWQQVEDESTAETVSWCFTAY